MFRKTSIDLKKAGSAPSLVLDYLEGKKETRQFFDHPPTLKGFEAILAAQPYTTLNRSVLCERMNFQAQKVENTSKATFANITSLCESETYTVTTGHQLCLFTGPLYFLYKIATTINLAQKLKKEFPGKKFVPVYWMASEDHDFDEINHFNIGDYTVRWISAQRGAVGSFATTGMKEVMKQLEEAAGISENGQKLVKLFERSYVDHDNLADATRFLVNELFGAHGLVTIDGNDAVLKGQFREEFRDDLLEKKTFKAVGETIALLAGSKYNVQVTPRETNVFLLEDQGRFRLEKAGEIFRVVGTEKTLSTHEVEEMIRDTPERLSPNVTLRPLYQQKILPNIAYVGGPGELAYWLEFNTMFKKFGVTFPVLMPRNFFSIVDPATAGKLTRLGLNIEQLFLPVEETVKIYQEKAGLVEDTLKEQAEVEQVYSALQKKAEKIDVTLIRHVGALKQKHINALKELESKFNRTLRRQSQTETGRIKSAREALFPGGSAQERYVNFGTFALIYGDRFINEILAHADPFVHEHIILSE